VMEMGIAHESTEVSLGIVTISAGYSSLVSEGKPAEAEQLKKEADRALYRSKRNGRNQASGQV